MLVKFFKTSACFKCFFLQVNLINRYWIFLLKKFKYAEQPEYPGFSKSRAT